MAKKSSRMADEAVSGLAMPRLILSAVIGILVTLVLTAVVSLAISKNILQLDGCSWFGPLIVGISSFVCAWAATWRKNKKLFCGFISSAFYGLIVLVGGMLIFSAPMETKQLLFSTAALFIGALTGIFAFGILE